MLYSRWMMAKAPLVWYVSKPLPRDGYMSAENNCIMVTVEESCTTLSVSTNFIFSVLCAVCNIDDIELMDTLWKIQLSLTALFQMRAM